MRYRIIINPEQYQDNDDDDAGYCTVVEAKDADEAFELACAECEACNEWDEGEIDRDRCDVIDCEPDYAHFIEQMLKYNARLDELEIPPNGDDYNAIMELARGGAYTDPHELGR